MKKIKIKINRSQFESVMDLLAVEVNIENAPSMLTTIEYYMRIALLTEVYEKHLVKYTQNSKRDEETISFSLAQSLAFFKHFKNLQTGDSYQEITVKVIRDIIHQKLI